MESGISPLNFVWDRDQKHGIGDHSVGIGDHSVEIGDQVYNLGILGSFTWFRDQNFSKTWAQGSKLFKNSGIIRTRIYHVTSLIY